MIASNIDPVCPQKEGYSSNPPRYLIEISREKSDIPLSHKVRRAVSKVDQNSLAVGRHEQSLDDTQALGSGFYIQHISRASLHEWSNILIDETRGGKL